MYVTNRGWNTTAGGRHGPGSISVLDPRTRRVVATWPVPGGGSPDMGNVSADGKELWVSGRYDDEVYVFDTETGRMTHRIKVGREPHGLCVWPQPGRYSLGHTGNMRYGKGVKQRTSRKNVTQERHATTPSKRRRGGTCESPGGEADSDHGGELGDRRGMRAPLRGRRCAHHVV